MNNSKPALIDFDALCRTLAEDLSRQPDNTDIAAQLWRTANHCGAEYLIKKAQKQISESGLLDNADDGFLAEFSGSKRYRISSLAEWAKKSGSAMMPIGEAEEITIRNPPLFDGAGFHPSPAEEYVARSNVPCVVELRDARVLSNSSVVIVSDTAINDHKAHPQHGKWVSLEYEDAVTVQGKGFLLLKHDNFSYDECEEAILLSGFVAEAFGHWVPEFLPRLRFLEQHPDFKRLPIIVEEVMPPSHFEYLESMVSNRLIRLPRDRGLRCKRLLASPPPTFYPTELFGGHGIPWQEIGALSPSGLRYLREKVEGKITGDSPFGPKIYLTRRNMRWRRVANDQEIEQFLQGLGFATVEIENLSFADQVRMFRDAKWIVSPNGSSMLNTIYAPPTAKILALSQPGLFNWGGFYGPMRSLGYDPLFVIGDEVHEAKHADYSIPVRRLEQALEFCADGR